MHVVSDSLFPLLTGRKIMAVHTELQTERSSGRNPQVTQPQFLIYKIKGFPDDLLDAVVFTEGM